MTTILIVDDDKIFLDALSKNLSLNGCKVVTANNGKAGLESIAMHRPNLIISDIKMPEMDGIEFIKSLRRDSQVPVILMTGFSEFMETKMAYELGANEFIPKPFKISELMPLIERCLSPRKQTPDEDSRYCKLDISDFVTGRTIKFNIFARLTQSKYVKLAHQGEDMTPDRIKFYRQKGLNYLYLKREDFRKYVGLGLMALEQAHEPSLVETKMKLNILGHLGEVLQAQIRHEGVNEQVYKAAKAFVETMLDIVTDDVKAVTVLEELRNHSDYILIHSVGVSLYSVMIAQAVAWNLPSNKFKVAMGGLFHDVGLKELNRSLSDRPRYSLSPDEIKNFESHPLRGLEILNDLGGIPEDVREIVKQHHENCLSRGYPQAMKKSAIHPMAKLVAVADEFCDRILKGPLTHGVTPMDALQDMKINCVEQLDRTFFDGLTQLLKPNENTRL